MEQRHEDPNLLSVQKFLGNGLYGKPWLRWPVTRVLRNFEHKKIYDFWDGYYKIWCIADFSLARLYGRHRVIASVQQFIYNAVREWASYSFIGR